MTLTKERVAELEKAVKRAKLAGSTYIAPGLEVHKTAEVDALLSAYRTREAAIAECEAWRRCSTWERSMKGFTQEDAENLERAIAATDTARREENKGE